MIVHRIGLSEGDMYEIPVCIDNKNSEIIPYRYVGKEITHTVNYPDYFEDMQYSELKNVGVTSDKENIYLYNLDYYKLHIVYWGDSDFKGRIRYSSLKSFEAGTYICKCEDCGIIYSI
jgi:hypothetical protein